MVEVIVSDVGGYGFGYVYLFISKKDGKGVPILRSDAGQKLVSYNFNLTAASKENSADYFDVYNFILEFKT